jgi:serine protease SohB
MYEFFQQYGLFLAKTATVVVAIGVLIAFIAAAIRTAREEGRDDGEGRFRIKHLNERIERQAWQLKEAILDKAGLKKERQRLRKARREAKLAAAQKRRVFVLDFHGDLGANRVSALREEISLLLQVLREGDEVLVRLESAGGTIPGYGLAASQLRRVRDRGFPLTIAVDKVAASGGYMMASVGQRIIAAPFAVVGSIGVVAQLPNFHRMLQRHDIDFELHTAGEFKRTLTVFGENTETARAKFREELEDAHQLFKSFLAENRPQLALDQVATGEHWYGLRALHLGLVDELRTSDDFLLERAGHCEVYELRYRPHRSLSERLSEGLTRLRKAAPGLLTGNHGMV